LFKPVINPNMSSCMNDAKLIRGSFWIMKLLNGNIFFGDLRQVMRKYPLFCFFFLAYAFSWIMTIPFILADWGIIHGDFRIAFVLKSFGPFLSAYIMTGVLEGKTGLHTLRQRIRQYHAGWLWYLLVLLGIPLLLVLGIIIQPGAFVGFGNLKTSLLFVYIMTFVIVLFGGGPLGEEPGWRGFALPRMQPKYGALKGTLLLGVLWASWHLPDFLTSAQGGGPGTGASTFLVNFPTFLLLVLSIAIIITWVFNHTKGSVFISVLVHASINTPQVVFVPLIFAVSVTTLNIAALIGFGVPALLVIILTKGQLGYQPKLG
jgi:uncharacterized protein